MKGKLTVVCFVVSIVFLTTCHIFIENVDAFGKWSNGTGRGTYEIFNEAGTSIGIAFFDVKVTQIPHPKHGYGYVKWKIDFAETNDIDVILESTSITSVTFGIVPNWGFLATIEATADIIYVSSNSVSTTDIKVILKEGTVIPKPDAFRIEIGDGSMITVGNLTIIDYGNTIQDSAITDDAVNGNDSYDYIANNSHLIRGNVKIAIKTIRR